MKFSYLEHVGSDSDVLHGSSFAFEVNVSAASRQSRMSNCEDCMIPFQVLNDIGTHADTCSDGIMTALRESQQKLMLFMAHQHLCKNQQTRIQHVFQEVTQDNAVRSVLLLVDYKMKLEPIRYREKTIEFFGKRGMSWHGAVIFYSDGEGGLNTMFVDQILDNDMKQDCAAVASLIDAALSRTKRELPSVVSFTLLSDNARCYQNDYLPVMLPHIAHHHSLEITSFIHSETQQGKSLVDAHFALAMMQVNRYVNTTRKDVCTPSAVIDAINWNGGIANTVAEMVRIDRKHTQLAQWMTTDPRKCLAKLGRNNEYTYKFIKEKTWEVSAFALSFRDPVLYKFGYCMSHRLEVSGVQASLTEGATASNDADEAEADEEYSDTEDISGKVQREATYVSSITGITVWGEGRIRRLRRRRSKRISPTSAIKDSTEDQEEEKNMISGSTKFDEEDEPVFLQCKKCGAPYRREERG